jgi:hypothetical protein
MSEIDYASISFIRERVAKCDRMECLVANLARALEDIRPNVLDLASKSEWWRTIDALIQCAKDEIDRIDIGKMSIYDELALYKSDRYKFTVILREKDEQIECLKKEFSEFKDEKCMEIARMKERLFILNNQKAGKTNDPLSHG